MAASFDIGCTNKQRGRRILHPIWVLLLLLVYASTTSAQDWSYRVRPGDTLWDLASEYLKPGIPWQRLQAHNRIVNPYQLPPGSTVRVPLAWLGMQPATARVVAVRGQATVVVPGNAATHPVAEGMELGIGALLRTARDATLSIEFADGTRLLLMDESELHLDRMSRYGKSGMVDTRLRLQRGRIVNTVMPARGATPSFIVDTPNASSAVRGTRFRVDAEEVRTRTEVVEGSVAVSTPSRSALVSHGYGAVVAAGQSTAIRAIPLLPAPDLSALPPKMQSARAELQWPAVEGAEQYRVQVSDTPTFDTLLADIEARHARATLPGLDDGRYFLRLRAIDPQGLEGNDAAAGFAVEALPEPPFAITPVAGSVVREAQPEFSWSTATDAAGYRFELADNAGFANPIASLSQDSATPLRLPQTLAPGDYYWRIATDGRNGRKGLYGDAVAFTLQPLQEAGEIASEKKDARTLTFRWRAGEPQQKYRFQLSRSPDFDKLRIDQVVEQPQITIPKLRAGTWYLRAQAIGSDGYEGRFPAAQSVKIPCRACKVVAGGVLWVLLAL